MYVGICRVVLHAEHCQSLKEKRSVIRRIKDQARARLDLVLAEVAGQDTWQRIVLGFAVVGGDRRRIEEITDKAVALIEDGGEARLIDVERELLPFGARDPLAVAGPADDGWAPAEWLDGGEGDER